MDKSDGGGELIQSNKIKAISEVVGGRIGPQLMGGICLGVTMQGVREGKQVKQKGSFSLTRLNGNPAVL